MKKPIFAIKIKRSLINVIIVIMLFILAMCASIPSSITTTVSAENLYYNGNKNSNNVCMMINVYFGNEYLDEILETLAKYDVKTTFFIGGIWASMNEEYLFKIFEAGHEIANHGYHHKDHDKLSYEDNLSEIASCDEIIKEKLGLEMTLFAPPSGYYNANTLKACVDLGYKTIMWTKDTIDWRDKDASVIYSRAIKNASSGDFILMHPTSGTATALENIILFYKSNGFNLTTVSECLKN